MNSFLDNIYGVFFSPVQTLRNIGRNRLVGQGIAAYILSNLVSSMSRTAPALPTGYSPEVDEILAQFADIMPTLSIISALFISPLIYIVMVSIWHLIADIFGGQGTAAGLLAALGFTQLPTILTAPFGLLYRLTGVDLTGFVGLAVLVWVIVLNVISIREIYRFSTGKSVLVYFLPYLILFALSVVFFTVLFGIIGPMSDILS